MISVESGSDENKLTDMIYRYLNTLSAAACDKKYEFARRLPISLPIINQQADVQLYDLNLRAAEQTLASMAASRSPQAIDDVRALLVHMSGVFVAATQVHESGAAVAISTLIKARSYMTGDGNEMKAAAWQWTLGEPEGDLILASDLYQSIDNGTLMASSKGIARSAKANALLNYLVSSLANRSPDDRTMIFATMRTTAYSICKWIQEDPRLNAILKPIVLVGHGSSGASRAQYHRDELMGSAGIVAPGMDFKKQQEVVTAFKNGNFNIMVTTRLTPASFVPHFLVTFLVVNLIV
jgi:ERCC4-related helicase